ncbi:hypothetical protein KIN20_023304 [Parelaphostrongylus tenuis]|uniref:Uncharacterized protein n=1 Tax=Parelaphostrongylus tenuis TaxID=148309 RepID=A0AAD5NC39_PARTN|nr:hypothetical protein KIN20_023304 [Parelaphostrongylus tenuis]
MAISRISGGLQIVGRRLVRKFTCITCGPVDRRVTRVGSTNTPFFPIECKSSPLDPLCSRDSLSNISFFYTFREKSDQKQRRMLRNFFLNLIIYCFDSCEYYATKRLRERDFLSYDAIVFRSVLLMS